MWHIEIRCDIYFMAVAALIERFRVMRSAVIWLT